MTHDQDSDPSDPRNMPKGLKGGKALRAILNAAGGLIPLGGGVLSAAAGAWSESEQEKINAFFEHWLQMLEDDLKEKARTILEIMGRVDMNDDATAERVANPAYQSLVRKAFRDWAGAESEEKRVLIRNILSNAAGKSLTDDDVIRMFLKWVDDFSELHFAVISSIYNESGVTRGRIWEKIGKRDVREDSAEADMFKLLIRDLSTGSIIRQHREKDYAGNFLRKPAQRRQKSGFLPTTAESAFEDTKGYELTGLGQQFVHYAMTELPLKIDYRKSEFSTASAT